MSDKICIVGGLGNMGRRYHAILNHLGADVIIHDTCVREKGIDSCTGIIIATPTHTHYHLMKMYSQYKLPMLVEKPITKDFDQLMELVDNDNMCWRMINQYEYFQYTATKSRKILSIYDNMSYTSYDYFKTGSDGIFWDCLNVIGLAEGSFKINNQSPIWNCVLNGQQLDICDMDHAYIWNIVHWLEHYDTNKLYALNAHEKVMKIYEEITNVDKM